MSEEGRTGHLWSAPPDSHGRSQCVRCSWWRLVVGDRTPLYSLDPSLVGTWRGIRPECDPEQAKKIRAALYGEAA